MTPPRRAARGGDRDDGQARLLGRGDTGDVEHAPATGEKYKDIAIAMGVEGVEKMTQDEYRKACVDAVRQLGKDVGIPQHLAEVGVKEADLDFLADSAMADACTPGNPKDPTKEDIVALYKSML